MKYFTKLKTLFIAIIFSVMPLLMSAQCGGGGTNQGSLSMLPDFQTISVNSGDRYTFQAYAWITYIFSFCQGGGNNTIDTQLEICDEFGTTVYAYNDDHCGLGSEITWNPTSTGTYSIVIHQYYCNDGGASAGTMAYRVVTPPNEQDCLGAIPLCQSSYYTIESYSGTGNYPNEIATAGGCPGNCM
ncbi:MAG: hypothetical protein ACP5DZ_11310, partial [Bacteroidales bacterium]